MAELQSAINIASSGDIIILANGTYLNSTLAISTSHVTVKAETPGGVYLNGTQSIDITGDNIIFSGFQFTSGDIGANVLITIFGNYNIVTQCNFSRYKAQKYIRIADGSQYNEISFCNIENKDTAAVKGCTIQINTSPTVPGYHTIRYCSFQNFPGLGGDYGNEPIRIGLGAESANISRTLVEYCYFNNTGLGDSENISVKCQENVIRYCTFDNNPEGMLAFRNGDRNVAYGNFFIHGSGGIRCKEANDIYCYNNYFETSGASGDMDALTFDYVSPNLSNINFVHNTFVDCGAIDLGGTGPTAVTFANNIFKKSSGKIFTNPNGQTTFAGNIYLGTLGITIPSGATYADPLLVINSDGYYGLSSSSPAIDASSPSYPAAVDITDIDDDASLSFDISGQARPATILKDVGCDEYTTGTVTNRPLTVSDVGPVYLGGPTEVTEDILAQGPERSGYMLNEPYPNPFNPTTTVRFRIPSNGNISLKVYDQLGREVATFFEGPKRAGQYQVQWNAERYPSGIYFCRLQTKDFTETKKLLLLK
jgi:poly(beta-D-mannuronate) lyase